ncbi:MAG: hypothetical protein V1933_05840 [Candidatus Omnitrophota bacterium]
MKLSLPLRSGESRNLMKGRNFIVSVFCVCSVLCFIGCAPRRDMEDVKKQILEFDPSFEEVLKNKSELDSQVEALRNELRDKHCEISSRIMELEEELKAARRQTYGRINEFSLQLDPQRKVIKSRISELIAALRTKESLRGTLKNSLRDAKKLLENKKLELPQFEEEKWRANSEDLIRQLSSLEEEIAALRRQARLYREELNLLKF